MDFTNSCMICLGNKELSDMSINVRKGKKIYRN